MEVVIKKFLSGEDVGRVDLRTEIFEAQSRPDIVYRVIEWQLAKRRSGTHSSKGVSDVSGTGRKPWRQKGTGRARQGSLRSPQFRGGAVIFGPVVRSHGFSLQKKVRNLGLKVALSDKLAKGAITFVEDVISDSIKTKDFISGIKMHGVASEKPSVLIVGGAVIDTNVVRAISNVYGVDVLPQQGINVYDIVRHSHLILSRSALEYLEKRLLK
ncbi:50S ribosomal protein L4 [Candidatus Hydrogenosomobacter endosymbioticus]|uniref:Large ribosomal subunit protein uL4 n=1 Tax=Candidatus Hydrogenosomobacter endosymbioticus TaxID=2558174 RepID=A0ABN6L615_9PROT|nr:50S ribosomal protein L4 [Candidatus Hydrogenosomobacter endosymbioticus]BDB95941.1 50S ribosomal protein L4 [Candidatus Hydrogenosomobacter endosymbioticus]